MAKGYIFDPDYEGRVKHIQEDELVKIRTDEMRSIRHGFYTKVGEKKIYSKNYEFGTFKSEAPKKPKKKLMDIIKGKKS